MQLIYASGHHADMRYVVGSSIPDAFFALINDGHTTIFLDKREFGVAKAHLASEGRDVAVEPLEPFSEAAKGDPEEASHACKLLKQILRKHSGGMPAELVVPDHLPLSLADYLRSAGIRLKVATPFFPERERKTDREVGCIETAIQNTTRAYQHIEEILAEATIDDGRILYQGGPLTSGRLKFMVESLLLADDLLSTEGIIISSGAQAAIPHHEGEGLLLPHTPIICDIFPYHRASGYFADMTRTYVKGDPSEFFLRMYTATLEAQESALSTLIPGVTGREVHEVCVAVFKEHGFETNDEGGFIHSTGHGLGLEVHETPSLTVLNERPLEPGNVVTVEPGLYYPKHGGVRIEDVAVITQDGHRNLTRYPKELLVL